MKALNLLAVTIVFTAWQSQATLIHLGTGPLPTVTDIGYGMPSESGIGHRYGLGQHGWYNLDGQPDMSVYDLFMVRTHGNRDHQWHDLRDEKPGKPDGDKQPPTPKGDGLDGRTPGPCSGPDGSPNNGPTVPDSGLSLGFLAAGLGSLRLLQMRLKK